MLIKNLSNSPVEFVSYDGAYPNLCSGLLILKVNGKEYQFHPYKRSQSAVIHREFWRSGGGLDSNYRRYTGEWIIDIDNLPDELKEYAYDIDIIFNENVEHGCCGGCE